MNSHEISIKEVNVNYYYYVVLLELIIKVEILFFAGIFGSSRN